MKLAALLAAGIGAMLVAIPSVAAPLKGAGMSRGVFDTGCFYSHTLRDDPLLHPGMAGHSHVHDFFGNRTTDSRSTGAGLVRSGADPKETTCKNKADRSGYWAPALYQDGTKLRPDRVHVYYRHRGTTPARPFPVGFGMITHKHFWWCGPGTMKHRDGSVPAACASGRLFVILTFPACWDGKRLFARNGSHVAFGMRCNTAHPVRLPELTMFLSYRVDSMAHTYSLASGRTTSAHADFLNAWEPRQLAKLVAACLSRGRVRDCMTANGR